jgi:hypothetical protein
MLATVVALYNVAGLPLVGKVATRGEARDELGAFTRVLKIGLLMAFVVLALSACGGGGSGGEQQQANKPRPLPENLQALRPGEY